MSIQYFPRFRKATMTFLLILACVFSLFAGLGVLTVAEEAPAPQSAYSPGAAWPNFQLNLQEFKNSRALIKVSCFTKHQNRAPAAHTENGIDSTHFFITHLSDPAQNQTYFCIMPLTKFQKEPLNIPHYYDTVPGLLAKQYQFSGSSLDAVVEDVREAMYFGFGCLPAPTDDDYSAAQMYVWEKLGFEISPGNYFGMRGDQSWYPPFKEAIEKRREAYKAGLPSLAGQDYEIEPGKETILTDDKGVLESIMLSAGYFPDQAQRIEGDRGYVDISWVYPNTLKLQASEDFANSLPVTIAWGGPSTMYCLDNGEEQAVVAPEYHLDPNSFSFSLHSTVKWLPPTPTARLTIQKLAPQVVAWDRQDLSDGHTLYKPIYEEKGLGQVAFKLTATDDVVTEEGVLPAGDFNLEFTTDSDGKAYFAEIPCVNYLLQELDVPAGYALETSPIKLSVVEDTDPTAPDQPFVVRNSRIALRLQANKVLQGIQNIEPAALQTNLSQMCFGLELKDDFANAYTRLPAGSLVAISNLQNLPDSSLALGERPQNGELWTSLELIPPFPGHFRLVELNAGAYHQAMAPLDLDLSHLEASLPLADGSRALKLNFPLYNQRKPEPEKNIQTSSPSLPQPEPRDLIVNPPIQNAAPSVEVKVNNVLPDPAPGQAPPIQVGSYVERRPDTANLAVQLPRTGAADTSIYSSLLLFLGFLFRKLQVKML